jgi:hypothetical protein
MTRPLLALLFVLTCGTAAEQTVTVTREDGQTETVRTEVATPADQDTDKPADKPDAAASTCLQSTGSRIVANRNLRAQRAGKPLQCATAAGRVYTRDELDRTGRIDIYDALRALDTGVR